MMTVARTTIRVLDRQEMCAICKQPASRCMCLEAQHESHKLYPFCDLYGYQPNVSHKRNWSAIGCLALGIVIAAAILALVVWGAVEMIR
jgi:hypothetical protein